LKSPLRNYLLLGRLYFFFFFFPLSRASYSFPKKTRCPMLFMLKYH